MEVIAPANANQELLLMKAHIAPPISQYSGTNNIPSTATHQYSYMPTIGIVATIYGMPRMEINIKIPAVTLTLTSSASAGLLYNGGFYRVKGRLYLVLDTMFPQRVKGSKEVTHHDTHRIHTFFGDP